MPVELERRAVTGTGVDEEDKWCALERVPACGVGVNVPERRMPFAWAVEGKKGAKINM